MSRLFGTFLVLLVVLAACGQPDGQIVVAAGTTLVDSGFLEALVETYQVEFPEREVTVVGRSSAEVLALGEAGSADLLITHAPELESEFIDTGVAARADLLFTSDYVLVAPPSVAQSLGGLPLDEVLERLVDRRIDFDFISRGDRSGTHQKERALWAEVGGVPHEAAWYLEAGQGMGAVLQIASQKRAIALSELGAFLAVADVELEIVELSGAAIENPYTAIVPVDADPDAELLLDWIQQNPKVVSELNKKLFGVEVYKPAI